MSPKLTDYCPHCGKRIFRTWAQARVDAKRLSQKRNTKVLPYWSRACHCIHIGDHSWIKRS